MNVSQIITTYRSAKGLSRIELGRRCKISHSYISRIELGQRPHQQRCTLDDIASALELCPEHHDHLLISGGYAPDWVTDVTIRQMVFLLRHLPSGDVRRLRKLVHSIIRKTCKENPYDGDYSYIKSSE